MKYIILITGQDEFETEIESNFDPYDGRVFEDRAKAWDYISEKILKGFIATKDLVQVTVIPVQVQSKTIN